MCVCGPGLLCVRGRCVAAESREIKGRVNPFRPVAADLDDGDATATATGLLSLDDDDEDESDEEEACDFDKPIKPGSPRQGDLKEQLQQMKKEGMPNCRPHCCLMPHSSSLSYCGTFRLSCRGHCVFC